MKKENWKSARQENGIMVSKNNQEIEQNKENRALWMFLKRMRKRKKNLHEEEKEREDRDICFNE